MLACALGWASPATAQDWDKQYRLARTANYVSYVAPAAGIGGAVAAFAWAKNENNVLATIIGIGFGVMSLTAGIGGGAPLQSWSGNRGARALSELGTPVSNVPGVLSWVGTGAATGGVVIVFAGIASEGDSDVDFLGLGLAVSLIGFVVTYGAGLTQWGVNRKGWQQGVLSVDEPSSARSAPTIAFRFRL